MRVALWKALALFALASCGDDCEGTGTGDPGGSACCKVCTDSKPCGDSCIARNQTCRKGIGCACSGLVELGAPDAL